MRFPRRAFLAGTPGALALACKDTGPSPVRARFEGQDPTRGHRLRDGSLRTRKVDSESHAQVLIVGAGAAGLSAAWRLKQAGFSDFKIFELESAIGGTARSGQAASSAFPMGAHYLPAPAAELSELHTLLQQLGLIVGQDAAGRTQFLPSAICAAPTERYLYKGIWHPGVYPASGQSEAEADDFARWRDHLRELSAQRDAQGRPSFRLPLDASSDALRHLDRISISEYLNSLGITSWRTHWFVDYACRDDYGTRAQETSAFAALHHFLCRGLDEDRDGYLLTAPEGNGRLIDGLAKLATTPGQVELDSLVVDVDADAGEILLWRADGSDTVQRWRGEQIIWAAPRFLLSRVLRKDPFASAMQSLTYAPWLVANLELSAAPKGPGASMAWDNVAIEQDDLGYVLATHGDTSSPPGSPAHITFYQAFAVPDAQLKQARAELLAGDANFWGEHVMSRLERMHGNIRELASDLRLHRWGHAMVRPTPGSLFSPEAEARRTRIGRVVPCSTDTRGVALFEEAFYAGLQAADQALAMVSGDLPSPAIPT